MDKAGFQHDMTFGDFKDLNRRTTSDKVLRDKALILLKIENMMGMNVELLQWFIHFLIKKSSGGVIGKEIMQSEELAKELHKQ